MITAKACPKCHGDTYVDKEDNADVCLQCGKRRYLGLPDVLLVDGRRRKGKERILIVRS